MNSLYSKNYFEKYAALTLLKILSIEESDIIQSDCPDLKINCMSTGIEVTQALTCEQAIADKKKKLYSFYDGNPFDQIYVEKTKVFNNIKDAILRKEEKSKHYQIYNSNGLYIYSHCNNLSKEEIYEYLLELKQIQFFQHIYINAVTNVYDYHIVTKSIDVYQYSLKELLYYNQESLEYEKTCPKKRKKIIIS